MRLNEKPGGAAGPHDEHETTYKPHNTRQTLDCQSIIDVAIECLGGRLNRPGDAMVLCPVHDDTDPSLHLECKDSKLLAHCMGGCSQDNVIQALKSRGLWPALNKEQSGLRPNGIPNKWYGKLYVAHWAYHSEKGEEIGHTARYQAGDDKDIIPFFKREGGKWKSGGAEKPRPLYNRHDLHRHQSKPVLVAEGEKAADAARRVVGEHYVCSTWPGGTNAVLYADWQPLQGREVIIWPDKDGPGDKAAKDVANQCRKVGAKSVKVVKPPDGVESGWDLADAEAEGWTGDQIRKWIEQACASDGSGSQAAVKDTHPEPLPDELLPVAPFDFDLLPESLRQWVEDIAERIQCPPDFVAAAVMAALSVLIMRKVGIRPQAKTDWTVICNLWALIVGRPGVLKSPALEAALAPLKRLIAAAMDEYQKADTTYQIEAQAAKLRKEAAEKQARKALEKNPGADLLALLAVDEVGPPRLKRYIANDTSPASLGELLRQNPYGLLAFRDEIVSLLKSLDKEGAEEGRGFYLTAWNGDSSYTFDRIGRGLNLYIPAVCLSVLGGTQPGRLSEYISDAVKGGAADDGLIQRFGVLVWPDTGGRWKDVDRWPDTEAKNRAFKVFDYLDRLDPLEIGAEQDTDPDGTPDGIPYLRFEPAALELFLEWRTDLERRLRGELHPALESHFAKYRKLIPSLALITHLADSGTGPVSERAILQALAWGEYLETHAQRAYGSVSQPEVSVAKALLRRIKKGDLPPAFSSRDVWRPGWAKLSDKDQVKAALQLLEDYGWIAVEKVETGGRPATVYHVHPEACK